MSKEFKDGYEYANQQLKLGVTPKELEIQIDDSFDFNDFVSGMIARWREIQQLLAQPEHNNTQYLLDQVARLTAENAMLKEKWLAPPTREPLSNIDIKEASRNAKDMSFYNGVKWAERQHGIGGGE